MKKRKKKKVTRVKIKFQYCSTKPLSKEFIILHPTDTLEYSRGLVNHRITNWGEAPIYIGESE